MHQVYGAPGSGRFHFFTFFLDRQLYRSYNVTIFFEGKLKSN